MARLSIGTAAFSGPYGVKGDGSPNKREQQAILKLAAAHGVDMYDRADDYGPQGKVDWMRVTWKTRMGPTLPMLQAVPLYAALVHEPAPSWVFSDLLALREWGGVERVGVSAYSPEQLDQHQEADWDIVQVPLNILDGRFLLRLHRLHAGGVEIHVRSAFLQGALLMDPTRLPDHFGNVRYHLADWHVWREHEGLTAVQAALGPLLSLDCVDRVVVGVHSVEQLREVLAVKPLEWTDRWAIDDVDILEPWRWPRSS